MTHHPFRFKSVSIISAAALLGALVSPASAASSLTDIPNNYAASAIQELVSKGIMNGTGGGKFTPEGNISRQDFVLVLARALNLDLSSPPATASFKDVPATSYAYSAVEAAVKAGLIKGLGGGQFGAVQNITREQMAVIFVNALGVDPAGKAGSLTFPDSSSIASWAKDAVAAAVEYGLMVGRSDGTFSPSITASRQDVALVTTKFLVEKNLIDEKEAEPTPTAAPTPTATPTATPTSAATPEPAPISSAPTPEPTPIQTPTPTPLNEAPTVKNLEFTFADDYTGPAVGKTVTVNFDYEDAENDSPERMHFRWFNSSEANDPAPSLIPGNDYAHYTPSAADIGKYISVEITPVAASGTTTGQPVTIRMEQPVYAEKTKVNAFEFTFPTSITLNYFAGTNPGSIHFHLSTNDHFVDGSLKLTIEGLTFATTDMYALAGQQEWTTLNADQISEDGHTVTINGINSVNDFSFELYNKTIPAPGIYSIKAAANANDGGSKTWSDEQTITYTSLRAPD